MADINIAGFVEGVRYMETCVIVTITENLMGYKRKDGTVVKDNIATWHVIYKPYFKKYIAGHFAKGEYVKIKGMVLPYTKANGEIVEGCSVIGQTIDLAPWPNKYVRAEKKLTQDPAFDTMGVPNIDDTPDF